MRPSLRFLRNGCVVLAAAAAAVPASASPVRQVRTANAVDLSVRAELVQQAPGTAGTQQLTITNQGERTTGGALVTYVTPPYTNIDRAAALPEGCAMRYSNPDPTVPEVVTCAVPEGLAGGGSRTLRIPIEVTTRAWLSGTIRGSVTVAPCPDSPDTEANPNDNWLPAYVSLTRPTPPVPEGNHTGLYLAGRYATLAKDGTAAGAFLYGNVGPAVTLGNVQIVAVTPFAFSIDRSVPLPEGCALALEDSFLGTPEIVVCELPPLAVEEQRELRLPLRAAAVVPPRGQVFNPGLIAPASGQDVDPDQSDNIAALDVFVPVRSD